VRELARGTTELLLLHSRSYPSQGILACSLTFRVWITLSGSSLLIFSTYKTDGAHGTLITRGAHVNLGSARGKGRRMAGQIIGGVLHRRSLGRTQLNGFAQERLNVGRRQKIGLWRSIKIQVRCQGRLSLVVPARFLCSRITFGKPPYLFLKLHESASQGQKEVLCSPNLPSSVDMRPWLLLRLLSPCKHSCWEPWKCHASNFMIGKEKEYGNCSVTSLPPELHNRGPLFVGEKIGRLWYLH
jgi:hypothetical protein